MENMFTDIEFLSLRDDYQCAIKKMYNYIQNDIQKYERLIQKLEEKGNSDSTISTIKIDLKRAKEAIGKQ